LQLADRLRQHHLERTRARILGEGAHRHRRDEKQQHPRQEVEHRAQRRDTVQVQLAKAEEAVHGDEDDQQDVRRGLVEQRLQLAPGNGPRRLQRQAPVCVSCWTRSSRVPACRCSSYSVQPRDWASAKISGRKSRAPSAVSVTATRPSAVTGAGIIRRTPGSCPSASTIPAPAASTAISTAPAPCAISWSTGPSATIFPRLMISNRGQVCCTSESPWG